jgi:lipoprotein-releasing system permease protein
MILAVAVSSGFRREVRNGLSSLSGDILISAPDLNVMGESRPVDLSDPSLGYVASSRLVEEMQPVVWRAGIVRNGEGMHGVLVKGVRNATNDTVPLGVSIPRKLAQASGLKPGDRMLTYFVGDALKMRQFHVVGIMKLL